MQAIHSVFRTYIETTEANQTVSKQTETTPNFPKKTKICSLSNCIGWSSVCFGIEPKQPKQNCFETNRNNPNFFEKIPKYAFYHTVSVAFLFDSVQSKHRNSLFRYRTETTETNVLFRIVLNLVMVPVSIVSNRN